MFQVWISFVLVGLPLSLCCLHEACLESLSIYNFSQKSNRTGGPSQAAGKTPSGSESQSRDSGLINDARYILQLPLMWSMELIILYALLLWLKPSWVEIPLHAYFLLVGCQTLYSYLKAKSSGSNLGGGQNQIAVKVFAGVLTAITALSYVLHLIVDKDGDIAKQMASSFWQKQLYWISNDAIGYTLLIKLVSTVQIGKFHLVLALYALMITYDCIFVLASDVMVTVATKVENPMKFIFPSDLISVLTEPASSGTQVNFSIIGFGDIFIPALLASLSLRMDFIRAFTCVKREMTSQNSIQRQFLQ